MVDTYLLNEFLTLYHCGTLSAAAKELHISQPALSRSMQKLEEIIGVPIFDRNRNKMTVNDNGKILAMYADRLLSIENEMLLHIREYDKNSRTFMIGSCSFSPQQVFATVARKSFPDIIVESKIDDEKELFEKLEKDIYKFIVVTKPVENEKYVCYQWKDEQFYVSLPPSHPLAKRKEIALSEINGNNVLLLSELGFWLNVVKKKMPNSQFVLHDNRATLATLISAVNWPVFLTNFAFYTKNPVKYQNVIPITDAEANVTYYCVAKKNFSKKLEKLIEITFESGFEKIVEKAFEY